MGYGLAMNEAPAEPSGEDTGATGLRGDLARGDRAIAAVAPVLRHLLVHDDQSLFGDDIVARIRGMLDDMARQLVEVLALAECDANPVGRTASLAAALPEVPGLLGHLHTLALEFQTSERLQQRLGLDPVLSPLLQALIASPDSDTAAVAMKLLAAQARFVQLQRRMQLPLAEIPGELLHGVLAKLGDAAEAGAASVRAHYDEAATRQGLIARLVSAMGSGALAALALPHAGVAIFATALAQAHGQATPQLREFSVLCLQDGQAVRLALALRAAGVKRAGVEENLLALNPDGELPEAVFRVSAERAAALLNDGRT